VERVRDRLHVDTCKLTYVPKIISNNVMQYRATVCAGRKMPTIAHLQGPRRSETRDLLAPLDHSHQRAYHQGGLCKAAVWVAKERPWSVLNVRCLASGLIMAIAACIGGKRFSCR